MNDTHPEDQNSGTSEPEKAVKGPSISELPPKGIPDIPVKDESRLRSLGRRLLTWLVLLLIGIIIGALALYWVAYRPLRSQLDQTSQQLTQSQQQSASLQTQVDQLKPLETKNQDLQKQIKQNQILISLLSARINIAIARVALAEKDIPSAQAALNQMNGNLKTLQNVLPSDQQSTVSELQNRLKLATSELTSDTFAADSDMKVLAKSLDDLASKYPANP